MNESIAEKYSITESFSAGTDLNSSLWYNYTEGSNAAWAITSEGYLRGFKLVNNDVELFFNATNLSDYDNIWINYRLNTSGADGVQVRLTNGPVCSNVQLFQQNNATEFANLSIWANMSSPGELSYNQPDGSTTVNQAFNASVYSPPYDLYFTLCDGLDFYLDEFYIEWETFVMNITSYATNPITPVNNDNVTVYAFVNDGDGVNSCVFDVAADNVVVVGHENGTFDGVTWNSTEFEANQSGTYWYNMTCYDNSQSNLSASISSGFAPGDTVVPEIILVEPVGGFGFTSRTGIPLSWSVVDVTGLRSCWYTLDNGTSNTSIGCSQNTTFSVGSNGDYTLIFFGEDFGSNQASNQSSFSVNQPDLVGGGGGGGPTTIINISAKSTLGRVDKYVFILSGRGNFSDVIGINKKVKSCQATNGFSCSYKDFDVSVSREFVGRGFYEVFEGELLIESIDGDAVRIPLAAHLINIGWSYPIQFNGGGFGNDYLFEMEGDLITGIRVWWVGLVSVSLVWIWIERRKTRNVYAKRVVSYKKQLFRRLR